MFLFVAVAVAVVVLMVVLGVGVGGGRGDDRGDVGVSAVGVDGVDGAVGVDAAGVGVMLNVLLDTSEDTHREGEGTTPVPTSFPAGRCLVQAPTS